MSDMTPAPQDSLPIVPTTKVSARQRRVILSILREGSIKKGLKEADASKSAFYRWRAESAFAEAWETAVNAVYVEGLDLARAAYLKATEKLCELLDHEDPRIAMQAAAQLRSDADRFDRKVATWREIQKLKRKQDGGTK